MSWRDPQIEVVLEGVELRGGSLRLDYRVANCSQTALHLVNRLFRVDRQGRVVVDPNLVYALVLGDELRLSKELLDPPQWASHEGPPVPYLTHLAPGGVFTEPLVLGVPVHEYYPWTHFRLRRRPQRRTVVRGVTLTVGFLSECRPEWIRPLVVHDREELAVDRGFARRVHVAISTPVVACEVPCTEPTPLDA